ncbi:hypothetical protein, variant [Aphanomyces invadans]|nr:hypothetical protein, variant [Aphanomyces invadans]ETV95210.1 hypothetical protein, variant [Aphanomyces invadans]|eukprot:XP_008875911.1 hypothetical protein, variant [Aphanomyces invadans]
MPPNTKWIPPAVVTVGNAIYLFLINVENRRDDLLQSLSVEFRDVREHGTWRRSDGMDLPPSIRKVFLKAVERQVGEWIVQHSSFAWTPTGTDPFDRKPAVSTSNELFLSSEPTFEFRTLSSNRKDNWSTLRDDEGHRPSIRTKVVLSRAAQLLVFAVVATKHDWATSDRFSFMRTHGLAQLTSSKVDVWDIGDNGIFSCDVLPRLVEKSRCKRPREERSRDAEIPVDVKEVEDVDDDDKDDDDDAPGHDIPDKKNPLLGQFDPDEEFLVPVAPELPSKGRDVFVEFPLDCGSVGTLKRARHVQPFLRKLKRTKRKKDEAKDNPLATLARVKVVDHEPNIENMPMPLTSVAPASRPYDLNRQALEWLASDSQAELSASKKSSAACPYDRVLTAHAYKTTSTVAADARYLNCNVIPPPNSRVKVQMPDFRYVNTVTCAPSPCLVDDRSDEVTGLQMLAKTSIVGWWRHGEQADNGPVASEHQVRVLEALVKPHLQSLSQLYGFGASKWLNVHDYLMQSTTDQGAEMESQELKIPSFLASKADSLVAMSPSLLPEWSLRSCNPLSGPKPVRYGIICPHTSNDWVASLATRYMSSLRSSYVNANLGSLAACDLSTLDHRDAGVVDVDNALLVIHKSDDPNKPFKTYSEAASCFDRWSHASGVRSTVFVVAPFGRKFSRRLSSLYGALSRRGRSGRSPSNHVSFHVVYVEDLVETCVHVQPTYFREQSFALYDTLPTSVPTGHSEDVSLSFPAGLVNRMYQLADSTDTFQVLLGYAVVNGWLVSAVTNSSGRTLTSDAVFIDSFELKQSDMEVLVDNALAFLSVVRDDEDVPGALVATKLGALSEQEVAAWHDVWKTKSTSAKAATFVKQLVLSSAQVDRDIRWNNLRDQTATACAVKNVGIVLPPKLETNSMLSLSVPHPTQHTLQLRVESLVDPSTGNVTAGFTIQLLKCFHELAWLTVHPTTMHQMSALPLHLFAVEKMMALAATSPPDGTASHPNPEDAARARS